MEEVPPECSGSLALGGEERGCVHGGPLGRGEMMLPRGKFNPRGNNFENHLIKF